MKRTEGFERRCAMDLCHHPPFEVLLVHSQNTSVDLRSSTECKIHTRQSASSLRDTRTSKEKPFCSDEDCGDCENSTAPTTRHHHHHHLDSSLQCDDDEKSNEEMLTMALLHNKEQHDKQKRKVSIEFPLPAAEVVPRENDQEEGQTVSLAPTDQTTSVELKRGVDRNLFQTVAKSCSRRNLFLKPTCQEGSEEITEIAHSHKELDQDEDKGNSNAPSDDLTSTREDFLQKFREIQQSRFILETSTVPKEARRAAGWLKGLSTRSILSLSPKPSQRKLDVLPDDAKEPSQEEDRPTFTREGLLKRRVSDVSIEQLSQRFRRSSMEFITRVTSSRHLLEADHTDDATTRNDLSQKKVERAIPTRGLVHQVSNRMFNYQGSKSFEQDDEDEDDDYYNHTASQNVLFSKMQQVEANNLMSLIRRDE